MQQNRNPNGFFCTKNSHKLHDSIVFFLEQKTWEHDSAVSQVSESPRKTGILKLQVGISQPPDVSPVSPGLSQGG